MEKKDRPKKDKPITKKELIDINKMLDGLESSQTITKKRASVPLSIEQKKHNYTALATILSEYMDSYILIGYDLNEEPIVAMRSITPMQNKAVLGLLEDIAGQILWNDGPRPSGDYSEDRN